MSKLGRYEIEPLVTERFRLDGGAMFGSVPKTLWSRVIAPDADNRIPMVCRVLVLRDGARTILIDVGSGRKWSDKEKQIYQFEYLGPALESQLSGVTDIVLTHLHFDHGGGISKFGAGGKPELAFPGAQIYLHEGHLAHAKTPGVRERASFLPSHVEPVANANVRECRDGEEILPGIFVHRSDGHTQALQWITLRGKASDGEEHILAFPSDLAPTAHHLPLPYVMGYDMCVEKVLEEKRAFLEAACAGNWIVVFEHDADTEAGLIQKDSSGKYALARGGALKSLLA